MTISMIVCTPRPSGPTRCASAPSNSTSLEALERFPSLSLRRNKRSAFFSPFSSTRGNKKHVKPSGACASTKNASHIGAEQNHL